MVQAVSRDQIETELRQKAEVYWSQYDKLETVFEAVSKNYIAKQTCDENGLAVTMIKYKAVDVTVEMMEVWRADPTVV